MVPQIATQSYRFYDILFLDKHRKDFMIKDICGKRYGKWVVQYFVDRDAKSNRIYKCQCDCGTIKNIRYNSLKDGSSTRCKKCRMDEFNHVENLTGSSFGKWKVGERFKKEDRKEWYYKCICECGTNRDISGNQLRSGWTTQCHRCRNKTHGMSYTPTFSVWSDLFQRCLNPNHKSYHRYGGRGIKICDRWMKFENFYEDMGERPKGLQIDRTNNDGNYEPGNCRWVTPQVNHANRNISLKKKGI